MNPQQTWYAAEINLEGQIIIDLGANIGELSEFFWLQGKGSNTVISVEPLPQNIDLLKTKVAQHQATTWQLRQAVASNKNGDASVLYEQNTESGWNSYVLESNPPRKSKTLAVESTRLRDIHPSPNVIKVDIEGHEYAVLFDSVATMPSIHTWAVELHMRPDYPLEKVTKLFELNGYKVCAAGMNPKQPNVWQSIPINTKLTWQQIPAAKKNPDGSEFKSLHIIAKRDLNG